MKSVIKTNQAPSAIGPYSQAIQIDGVIYLSGKIGMDPATTELVEGGVVEQAVQVTRNVAAVISAAGATIDDIVKLTLYLTSMDDYPAVNDVLSAFFSEPYPARVAVAVMSLPKGALVEIDAIAKLSA